MTVIHGSVFRPYPPKEVRKKLAIAKIELENIAIADPMLLVDFELEFPLSSISNSWLSNSWLRVMIDAIDRYTTVYFDRIFDSMPLSNKIQIQVPIPKFDRNIEDVCWYFMLYVPDKEFIGYWVNDDCTPIKENNNSWRVIFLTNKEEEREFSGHVRSMIFEPLNNF